MEQSPQPLRAFAEGFCILHADYASQQSAPVYPLKPVHDDGGCIKSRRVSLIETQGVAVFNLRLPPELDRLIFLCGIPGGNPESGSLRLLPPVISKLSGDAEHIFRPREPGNHCQVAA